MESPIRPSRIHKCFVRYALCRVHQASTCRYPRWATHTYRYRLPIVLSKRIEREGWSIHIGFKVIGWWHGVDPKDWCARHVWSMVISNVDWIHMIFSLNSRPKADGPHTRKCQSSLHSLFRANMESLYFKSYRDQFVKQNSGFMPGPIPTRIIMWIDFSISIRIQGVKIRTVYWPCCSWI